jgi:hypothetical protein
MPLLLLVLAVSVDSRDEQKEQQNAHYKQQIAELKQVVKQNPNDMDAHLRLASTAQSPCTMLLIISYYISDCLPDKPRLVGGVKN